MPIAIKPEHQDLAESVRALVKRVAPPEFLHEALETFYSAMARRPKPLDPHVLNERLLSARWSI